ncbi:MAG: beta-lactamase family protein [Geodermatophilaceae bacterium]|nr:beta-lactamase family protein [Geodermatophilaceae bacterium]
MQSIVDQAVTPLLGGPSGVVVGLLHEGKEYIWGYGHPKVPDGTTLYEIGSLTKVLTGLLLATLVTQGKLSLDEPAGTYLPEVPTFPSSITLRQLATHTAGLPRIPGNIWRSLLKDTMNPFAHYSQDDLLAELKGFTPAKLAGRAGQISYSNLGMGLLGQLLARHLGISYESAGKQHICEPLGMRDTTMTQPAQARYALPLSSKGKPLPPFRMPTLEGAGAFVSTAHDMLRFLRAYLNPDQAMTLTLSLQSRTMAAPTRVERIIGWLASRNAKVLYEPVFEGIGLGWIAFTLPQRSVRLWMHTGGTSGSRSIALFIPEYHQGLVVFHNRGASEMDLFTGKPTVEHVAFAVLEHLVHQRPTPSYIAGG